MELDRILERLHRKEITRAQAQGLARKLASKVRRRQRVPSKVGGLIRSAGRELKRAGGAARKVGGALSRRRLGGGAITGAISGVFGAGELGSGELPPEELRKQQREQVQREQRAYDAQIEGLKVSLPPGVGRIGPVKGIKQMPSTTPKQPAPSTSSRTGARQRVRQLAQQILTPQLLLSALDSRRSSTRPLVIFPPTGAATSTPQLPASTPAINLPVNLTSGSFTPTAQKACQCKDKRKSERRRCKERAGVKWAGGRKKGKTAGSKCVVYFN